MADEELTALDVAKALVFLRRKNVTPDWKGDRYDLLGDSAQIVSEMPGAAYEGSMYVATYDNVRFETDYCEEVKTPAERRAELQAQITAAQAELATLGDA